ncbi:prenyltransferase [uncultured Megasphaera sp.]|uniref:prenyltransferase n=1 Tax=uncultured Megasphaera sp. TaxID=165188 RepID=UPI00259210DD|nr:prenyltransferase [uncultured Megasphaera sp.]
MKEATRRMTMRQAWNLAAPHTWPATLIPVALGELYCVAHQYALSLSTAIALTAACLAMQAAVNTLNDYFDFVKGTDKPEDRVAADDAVLVYGQVPPRQALLLGIFFLAVAAVIAIPRLLQAGIVPVEIGVIGAITVLLYSGGKMPISYLPFGEVVSGVVMGGGIPLGIIAVVTGRWEVQVLFWAVPVIIGIALIMMTNNTCDVERDRRSGRKTLPVILGRARARHWYRRLVALWLFTLAVCGTVYMGAGTLVMGLGLWLLGKKFFIRMFTASLTATERLQQMRTVVVANLLCGIAYTGILGVVVLGGALHG